MLDLARLEQFQAALAALGTAVPGLTRDLFLTHEAPDQDRGGVASTREARAA